VGQQLGNRTNLAEAGELGRKEQQEAADAFAACSRLVVRQL